MKKLAKTFALAALPLALAACGGGGGDNNAAADTPRASAPTSAPAPSAPSAAEQENPGRALEFHERNQTLIGYYGTKVNGGNYSGQVVRDDKNTVVTVGGQTYALPKPGDGNYFYASDDVLVFGAPSGKGGVVKTADGRSYESFQLSNSTYLYSQFGMATSGNGFAAVYRGVTPTSIPVSGSAIYVGQAILALHDANNNFKETEIGEMTSNVDFGTKEALFALKSRSYEGVGVAALNDAGVFYGVSRRYGVGVVGALYGPNAAEMAGEYQDIEKNVTAVFGAKRVE